MLSELKEGLTKQKDLPCSWIESLNIVKVASLPKLIYQVNAISIFKKSQEAFFFFNLFYLWLCWVFVAARRLFSSCGEQGLLFVVVHRLLIAVASLVAEHGL